MNPVLDSASEEFGPYEVFERLGIGGMAMVHRAKKRGPEGFEQNVALKRMLSHLAEDPSFVESFIREAKVASLLVHPNIAQVYDFGRIRGIYYIAMELVGGFDVRKLLRYANRSNEPIPLGVILSILGELCDALDHAHSFVDEQGTRLDIVHRDVSPSNLIVAHTGHLKVIDFGIAKASSRQLHTESGKVKGKLGYMSPEAALGMSSGPISDLFSTGVVAWELVTAMPLFTTRTDMETMQRIREATIAPPSHHNPSCPPELDRLILSALEREPEQRLSSASVFRGGLDDIIARYGIAVSARSVVEWMTRFAQPEDSWARNSPARERPPTRNPNDPTSLIRGSARPQRGSDAPRPRSPSRPPLLHRTPAYIALATEIWGEDQQTIAPDPGPDFNIANVRASSPSPAGAAMPATRVLAPEAPERPTVPPPRRGQHGDADAMRGSARPEAGTVPPPMRGSAGSAPPMRGSARPEPATAPPPMRGSARAEPGSSPPPMRIPNTQIPGLPQAAGARITELPLRGRPSTPPSTPIVRSGPQGELPAPLVPAPAPVAPATTRRRSKWPLLVLGLLAAVAGVLVVVLVTRPTSDQIAAIAPVDHAAAPVRLATVDAPAIEPPASEPDAATKLDVVEPTPDPTPTVRPNKPRPRPRIEGPGSAARRDRPAVPDPEPVEPTPPDPPVKPPVTPPVIPTPAKPARTPVVAATAVTKLSGDIPTVRANTSDEAVTVKICIDEQGRVTSVSSSKAPADVLGELQRGLASWRYKPYLRDGKPSAVCFPLSLRLVNRG